MQEKSDTSDQQTENLPSLVIDCLEKVAAGDLNFIAHRKLSGSKQTNKQILHRRHLSGVLQLKNVENGTQRFTGFWTFLLYFRMN